MILDRATLVNTSDNNNNTISLSTEIMWEEELRCGQYSFTVPRYSQQCEVTRLRSVTRHEHMTWSVTSDYKPLTLFTDAEIILLENNTCLGIRIYNKQYINLLIILVVSCFTYFLSIFLMRANNVSFSQMLPLLISTAVPILYQNLVDKGPFNIIMLFLGWNILLTTLPILYKAQSSKKIRISPNPPKNNKSVQIDMYTLAKDEDEDKMYSTNKSGKAFLIFYVICILASLLALFAIFYDTVKDNILDLVRKNI